MNVIEFTKRRIKEMKRNLFVAVVLSLAMVFTGVMFAQKKPAQNVSGKRHPNIAAAQRLTAQAFQRITDAQNANEWDLAGHAQKAKQLLDEANEDLKKSAEVSNINHQP
jgi:F0F1-type ATP synthase membrane subunit b/b'